MRGRRGERVPIFSSLSMVVCSRAAIATSNRMPRGISGVSPAGWRVSRVSSSAICVAGTLWSIRTRVRALWGMLGSRASRGSARRFPPT